MKWAFFGAAIWLSLLSLAVAQQPKQTTVKPSATKQPATKRIIPTPESPPKSGTASKAATPSNQPVEEPNSPIGLAEIGGATGEWSGEYVLTPGESGNCRRYSYTVKVAFRGKPSSGGPAYASGNLPFYLAGTRHQFLGKVCLPAPGASHTSRFNVRFTPAEGASMGLRDGVIVSDKLDGVGNVTLVVDEGQPILEVTSESSDPLTLMVTSKGYEFHSGKGAVRTPDGKLHRFEPAGNDTSKP